MDEKELKALINLGKDMELHEDDCWKIIEKVICPVCKDKELVSNFKTGEIGCNDKDCKFNEYASEDRDLFVQETLMELDEVKRDTPQKLPPFKATDPELGAGTFVCHLIDNRIYWYFHYYDPNYETARRKGDTRTIRRDPQGWNQKAQRFENDPQEILEDEAQTQLESKPAGLDKEKVGEAIEALSQRIPVQYRRHKNSKDAQAMEKAVQLLQELL